MAAENRLTAEQLSALTPGDPVLIEISGDYRHPRRRAGTVVRREGSRIVVSGRSSRGVPYVERYDSRDGVRVGGGDRAELVNLDASPAGAVTSEQRRQQLLVDAAYREWARNRGDVEKLHRLHAAISEALDGLMGSRRR